MAKRITIKDISEKLGVSRGTVDRALHDRGRIDPRTKKKILEYAEKNGYVPNNIARALVMQHSLRIAVVLPANPRYFFSEIAIGIRDAARELTENGYEVVPDFIYTKDVGDWERQIQILGEIPEKDYDGVIVVPSNTEMVTPYIDGFVENGIPVVTVNNDAPGSRRLCYVGEDSIKAGRIAGELMTKFVRGGGSVAILTGYKDSASMSDRAKGFESYIRDSNADLKVLGPYEYHEKTKQAHEIASVLVATNSDMRGIYLTTTTGLTAAARAVANCGKAGDIVIIGPDISKSIRRMMQQGMIHATIYQAPREQGERALQIITKKIIAKEEPKQLIIHTNLAIMINEIGAEDYEG